MLLGHRLRDHCLWLFSVGSIHDPGVSLSMMRIMQFGFGSINLMVYRILLGFDPVFCIKDPELFDHGFSWGDLGILRMCLMVLLRRMFSFLVGVLFSCHVSTESVMMV